MASPKEAATKPLVLVASPRLRPSRLSLRQRICASRPYAEGLGPPRALPITSTRL